MYTLNRYPIIVKKQFGPNDFVEIEYSFELKEIINDKYRYVISKYVLPASILSEPKRLKCQFDVIIRSMGELNDIYTYPEFACEFMDKQKLGMEFVYFEMQLPENDKNPTFGTYVKSFTDYIATRKAYGDCVIHKPVIFEKSDDLNDSKFDFKDNRPVYKGYAFISDWWSPSEFYKHYEEKINESLKQFSNKG